MFMGNDKMFLLKETENVDLVFHEYYREYQIVGFGGYVHATISITSTFNARNVALMLLEKINEEINNK